MYGNRESPLRLVTGASDRYVASWAGGGEQAIAGIKASGERIQKTAAAILRAFEPAGLKAAA